MSFSTAEKRPTLPRPGGGVETYMGNARLKTFFHLDAFPNAVAITITIIIIRKEKHLIEKVNIFYFLAALAALCLPF